MRTWELWEGETGHSFFPQDENLEWHRADALSSGHSLTWTTTARGLNPAMRALYDHLGYGEFKPLLRPDGTPYPEDEDDDWGAE